MKQDTTKEVLHTQGKFRVEWARWTNNEKEPISGFQIWCEDKFICGLNSFPSNKGIIADESFTIVPEFKTTHLSAKEAQANAELICKAVNGYSEYQTMYSTIIELQDERQKILESNIELLEALESIYPVSEHMAKFPESYGELWNYEYCKERFSKIETAVNNAKNNIV